MADLATKVVVVTGSSMGIGRAIAVALAQDGAAVVVNDPFGGEEAVGVVADIERMGGSAGLALGDVSDPARVSLMVAEVIDRFGRVDVLVNNAGISIDALTVNYKSEAWRRVVEVNLNGAFHMAQCCLPSMIENQWGRIINITSVAGQTGLRGAPAYSASKAGLIGFTKSLAREVARKEITVNCVALGYIRGGGLLDTVRPELLNAVQEQIPMGRLGQTEDVVGAVRYLVSDSASYVTGQTLNVNGGLFM